MDYFAQTVSKEYSNSAEGVRLAACRTLNLDIRFRPHARMESDVRAPTGLLAAEISGLKSFRSPADARFLERSNSL